MPYIHCNYSAPYIAHGQLKKLVALLLATAGQAYGYTDEQSKQLVSVFTKPYAPADHSVAAAEIEVRVKSQVYEHTTFSPEEVREGHMRIYQEALAEFIKKEKLGAGIVFRITFEDWSVTVLPAS